MQSVTLRAHFNGTQVVLDEPFSFEPDTKLLVTIVPDADDVERDEWMRFAALNLNAAYGDEEPEYTMDDLIEVNPDYEPR